jgi:hypothetical protein
MFDLRRHGMVSGDDFTTPDKVTFSAVFIKYLDRIP